MSFVLDMKATEGNQSVTNCHQLKEARFDETIIAEICDRLKTDRSNIVKKVEALSEENEQLQKDIEEFCYRYNARNNKSVFNQLIRQCIL